MFTEDELIPISALQHFAFCERQWGLIYLEGAWAENRLTTEGKHLHERADSDTTEVRGDVRIARGLRIRSLQHGMAGRADVVEFHKSAEPASIELPGANDRWRPVPIEYKRGRVKQTSIDEIQVCAQALCLEEMLDTSIAAGFLFYGRTRRRHPVTFTSTLRSATLRCAEQIRLAIARGTTPTSGYQKKCDRCSLYDLCLPKAMDRSMRVHDYIRRSIRPPDSTAKEVHP